jgi:transposase
MIRATLQMQVFVCVQPTDMRRSFDGLSGMVRQVLSQDPLSGALFLFRNRSRDRLKILYWDRDGLAIWYKRLEKGSFQFPTDLKSSSDIGSCQITSEELSLLLDGIDLSSVQRRPRFVLPEKLLKNQRNSEIDANKTDGRA